MVKTFFAITGSRRLVNNNGVLPSEFGQTRAQIVLQSSFFWISSDQHTILPAHDHVMTCSARSFVLDLCQGERLLKLRRTRYMSSCIFKLIVLCATLVGISYTSTERRPDKSSSSSPIYQQTTSRQGPLIGGLILGHTLWKC
jgi:hypothetical protein